MKKYYIIVNKGDFNSIREAAFSEKDIDWWDDNDPRSTICTECFAAMELACYLEKITGRNNETHELYTHSDSMSVPDGNLILIGNTYSNPVIKQIEKECGYKISAGEGVSNEGFRIKSFVFNGSENLVLSGKNRVGSLYAVYSFLKRLGVRWIKPGAGGTVYPSLDEIIIPQIDVIENPAFITRGCYSEYVDISDEELIDWMARNYMNFAHFRNITNPAALKKRGIGISGGGHCILYRFIAPDSEYPYCHKIFGGRNKPDDPYPVSKEYTGDIDGDGILSYYEAHPEWYAMINGKRSFRRNQDGRKLEYYDGDNYCTSNQYATHELCIRIVDDLISGEWDKLDYINFWMLDNGTWCSCEHCVKMGNYSYRMLMVVYHLRKVIEKAIREGKLKRNIKILTAAYHETTEPPDRSLPEDFDYKNCYVTFFPIRRCYVHSFSDTRCTETNLNLFNKYNSWMTGNKRNYKGDAVIGEYYNVSSFAGMPTVFSSIMGEDIPFYFNTGSRHFYYMHITSGRWGQLALTNYQYAQMLWNPFIDIKMIKKEYFESLYGEMAEKMEKLYTILEKASSNMKYIKHCQQVDGVKRSLCKEISENESLFQLKHIQYDTRIEDANFGTTFVQILRLYADCREILDEALLEVKTEHAAKNLIEDNMRFTYGEHMVKFIYYMTRIAILDKLDRKEMANEALRSAVIHGEILRNMILPVRNCGIRAEYFNNGLSASGIEPIYNQFRGKYG